MFSGIPKGLKHMMLCFEPETRMLWILPNPTDPMTRFVCITETSTLPEGQCYICVEFMFESIPGTRVTVHEVMETDGDLGDRF